MQQLSPKDVRRMKRACDEKFAKLTALNKAIDAKQGASEARKQKGKMSETWTRRGNGNTGAFFKGKNAGQAEVTYVL